VSTEAGVGNHAQEGTCARISQVGSNGPARDGLFERAHACSSSSFAAVPSSRPASTRKGSDSRRLRGQLLIFTTKSVTLTPAAAISSAKKPENGMISGPKPVWGGLSPHGP